MHRSASARLVPSRFTVPHSRQIDVCVMQNVCRYVQSDTVHAFRRRMRHPRNWCTVELEKALEKGYQLLQIHEVLWHFPRKTDTLFKEYIDTFAKIKLEASGYPKSCVTNEQKQAYVDILEHQGIQLDPAKIVYNPGLRALAKFMLNSFWGKSVPYRKGWYFKNLVSFFF